MNKNTPIKIIIYLISFCFVLFLNNLNASVCDDSICTNDSSEKYYYYKLKYDENIYTIIKKNNIGIDRVWTINSFIFPNKYNLLQIKEGDEILLPLNMTENHNDSAPRMLVESNRILEETAIALASGYSASEIIKKNTINKIPEKVNSEIVDLLNDFGTIRSSIFVKNNNKNISGSIDMLVPMIKSPDWSLFAQGGWREYDSRKIINIGVGGRWFMPEQIYGLNSFIDNDLTGNNRRIGFGGEYWIPYVKFSSNMYWRITNWHNSRDYYHFEERPANGYDLMMDFRLPSYSSMSMTLKYEQYFGNSVALFGRDNRQSDPYAGSIGLNWTPIPIITIGTALRHGKQGENDANINIGINYRIGVPWQKQITPNSTFEIPSLNDYYFSLVERNNNIILDYQITEFLTLALGNVIKGYGSSIHPIQVFTTSSHGLKNIEWSSPSLLKNNGKIILNSQRSWSVLLPEYNYTGNNSYTIQGIAVDQYGNKSDPATVQAIVLPPEVNIKNSYCSINPKELIADGVSTALMTCIIRDNNNLPQSGLASSISVKIKNNNTGTNVNSKKSSLSIFTESPKELGTYTAIFTAGTEVGIETLFPSVQSSSLHELKITLIGKAIETEYKISNLTVDKKGPLFANGTDAYTYTATVIDGNGKLAINKNVQIIWTTNNPSTKLTPLQNTMTDSEGYVKATLTSVTDAIDVIVSVKTQTQLNTVEAQKVSFKGNGLTITLDATPSSQQNEGNPFTFTATVRDAFNNVQSDIPVTWSYILKDGSTDTINLVTDVIDTKTKVNGEAQYKLFSSNGGFEKITVFVKIDNTINGMASKDVHITANEQVAPDIYITEYNWDGNSHVANSYAPAIKFTFGWRGMRFFPRIPPSGNGTLVYKSSNPSVVSVHQGNSTYPFFELVSNGNARLLVDWLYPSGRYITYITNMNVLHLVNGDRSNQPSGTLVNGIDDNPQLQCTGGQNIVNDFNDNVGLNINELVQLYNIDFYRAGLLGDPSIGAAALQVAIGLLEPDATDPIINAYTLKRGGSMSLYIRLCE